MCHPHEDRIYFLMQLIIRLANHQRRRQNKYKRATHALAPLAISQLQTVNQAWGRVGMQSAGKHTGTHFSLLPHLAENSFQADSEFLKGFLQTA